MRESVTTHRNTTAFRAMPTPKKVRRRRAREDCGTCSLRTSVAYGTFNVQVSLQLPADCCPVIAA
jgi:hypothetical protein